MNIRCKARHKYIKFEIFPQFPSVGWCVGLACWLVASEEFQRWEAFIGKVPRGFPVILTTTWAAIIQTMIQIQIIAALIQIQMQVQIQKKSFGKGSMKKKTIVLCGWVSVENTIFNVTRRSRSDESHLLTN